MIVKCSDCGARVSDMAVMCPNCGRDVRALKADGCSCYNCIKSACDDDMDLGPSGFPCLAYIYDDPADYD